MSEWVNGVWKPYSLAATDVVSLVQNGVPKGDLVQSPVFKKGYAYTDSKIGTGNVTGSNSDFTTFLSKDIGNINSYIGMGKDGKLQTFYDSNLQDAVPGSIKSATVDGQVYYSGEAGTDWGGLAAGVGAGVQGLAALGGLYYQDKNYKLQKDHQNYLKGRDAMADAKAAKFAKNVGNEAVV